MPILPLPQFEADLEEHDRKIYESLRPPSSIVVRFGIMYMVGEFPYSGDLKPGCGSKMVVKTHRGVELGEMLTSTCPNSGCSKSVSRSEMLEYIENSGGRDYPFFSMQGRVLRIATAEDLNEQSRIDSMRPQMARSARAIALGMGLPMKVVDAEPILGGEKITFYFTSEDRVDFRELVNVLAAEHRTRIEMRQVGARDEARLTADYERCGQHCCCKQFLKVLKPVSMRSAKIQKATLDPLKISGRCGRLMCCLRYEDQTYDELRARLPRKKSRVKTPEGWGLVLDGQILTQLVLVLMDHNGETAAVPVEDLEDPATAGPPPPQPVPGERPAPSARPVGAGPGAGPRAGKGREGQRGPEGGGGGGGTRPRPASPPPARPAPASKEPGPTSEADELLAAMETDFGDGRPSRGNGPAAGGGGGSGGDRGRRRGRGGGPRTDGPPPANPAGSDGGPPAGPTHQQPGEGRGPDGGGESRKRRRRRRGGPGGGGGGGGGGGEGGGGDAQPSN